MTNYEDTNIFSTPMYVTENGLWCDSYDEALSCSNEHLSWDPAAILSMTSFSFVCGDRTLLNEIKRKPWLSSIQNDGTVSLHKIPPHDTFSKKNETIASEFTALLREEIILACENRDEVYILLSGGMDSRIVAAIAAGAAKDGAINAKLTAVTWGLQDSRDVFYGKAAAELLGMTWKHLDLSPADVLQNIELSSTKLGCLVSGLHLHRMSWFRNVDKNALVLAGSYGDSIGRAEYSGKHLLNLNLLKPVNRYGLIKNDALAYAMLGVQSDLMALRERGQGKSQYVLCDYEMQGHYMRGMINQAMSVINNYCSVYQVFTSQKVFSYIWSIHPSLRTDNVYAQMLETLNPQLARLPWARTNKALSGPTVGAKSDLCGRYHRYEDWVGGELYERLMSYIDFQKLRDVGVFSIPNLQALCNDIRKRTSDSAKYNHFVWLVGLCQFYDHVVNHGKILFSRFPANLEDTYEPVSEPGKPRIVDKVKELGRKHKYYVKIVNVYNKLRKMRAIKQGLKKYPVKPE